MLEPKAIPVRRGCCSPTPRVSAQGPAKVLSEWKNTVNFHSTVKFTNFLLLFYFSWIACLLGCFFPNSQGTPEVGQYGIIVSWGTVNLWKTPFAFWIYGKRLNLVSLEQHLETQCFDFPNNFLRITGNENSRAQMDFSHRPHACRDAWFIWALQQRIMEQVNVPTQLSWEGLVLRMLVHSHPNTKVWARVTPYTSCPWEAPGSSTPWTELFLLPLSTAPQWMELNQTMWPSSNLQTMNNFFWISGLAVSASNYFEPY